MLSKFCIYLQYVHRYRQFSFSFWILCGRYGSKVPSISSSTRDTYCVSQITFTRGDLALSFSATIMIGLVLEFTTTHSAARSHFLWTTVLNSYVMLSGYVWGE